MYYTGMNNTAQIVRTTKVINGSRQVVVVADTEAGSVNARLYVNHGEAATLESWVGKTVAGAVRWANAKLGL